MKKRTLFYVKNPGGDIVLSKETGAEAYRILRSNCAFRTFPQINWGIMYKLVPECDYIDESEWERFIYTGFIKIAKRRYNGRMGHQQRHWLYMVSNGGKN